MQIRDESVIQDDPVTQDDPAATTGSCEDFFRQKKTTSFDNISDFIQDFKPYTLSQ